MQRACIQGHVFLDTVSLHCPIILLESVYLNVWSSSLSPVLSIGPLSLSASWFTVRNSSEPSREVAHRSECECIGVWVCGLIAGSSLINQCHKHRSLQNSPKAPEGDVTQGIKDLPVQPLWPHHLHRDFRLMENIYMPLINRFKQVKAPEKKLDTKIYTHPEFTISHMAFI